MPPTETRPEGHRIPGRPEDLDETYQDDAGVRRRSAGQPPRPPRIAGPTHDAGDRRPIADADSYATDGLGIRRIVRKGDPIPVGFELESGGDPPEVATSPAEPDKLGTESGGGDYDGQNKDALEAEADRRGLEVEGTGSDGRVTKPDLVAALEADDAAGEQPAE